MKTRCVAPMRIAKAGYIVMSVAFCAAGGLLAAFPERSAAVMVRAVGAFLVLFGAVKLVGYFSGDLFRLAFQYDLAFGILLIALGTIALLRPAGALDFLFVALGIAIFSDGLFKVQISLDARRFGIASWPLILALALAAGGAGLVLVFRPWESARVLTRLLGAALLGEGVLSLCVALSTVKIIKHQRPDVIEGDFTVAEDETSHK